MNLMFKIIYPINRWLIEIIKIMTHPVFLLKYEIVYKCWIWTSVRNRMNNEWSSEKLNLCPLIGWGSYRQFLIGLQNPNLGTRDQYGPMSIWSYCWHVGSNQVTHLDQMANKSSVQTQLQFEMIPFCFCFHIRLHVIKI